MASLREIFSVEDPKTGMVLERIDKDFKGVRYTAALVVNDVAGDQRRRGVFDQVAIGIQSTGSEPGPGDAGELGAGQAAAGGAEAEG